MTAPHFFVDALAAEPSLVILSERDSRHALRSLRLRPGEPVSVADGEGRWGAGTLVRSEHGRAVIEVGDVTSVERRSPLVSLLVAPPKGERLRWMIQKLTEIGVDSVWLTQSHRSVRTLEEERLDASVRRLEAVAREAAMQSRQAYITHVGIHREGATGFGMSSAATASQPVVVLDESAPTPLEDALPLDPPAVVTLAVGPEGGFADDEIEPARGRTVASLGPNILRTETAAVVGAAIVLARYGLLG
jgi:16S rRNA (uracil1498-N3)-methyltransferase